MVILEGMRSVVTFRGEQGKTCVCVPWMPVKNISTEKNLSSQKFKMPLLFSWITRTWGDNFPNSGNEFVGAIFFVKWHVGLYVSILKTSKNTPFSHFFGCDFANQCVCKTADLPWYSSFVENHFVKFRQYSFDWYGEYSSPISSLLTQTCIQRLVRHFPESIQCTWICITIDFVLTLLYPH